MELNKTQSSPAGWNVSRGEPGGPVLPCSGLPALALSVLLSPASGAAETGGLRGKEGGFVVK